MGVGSSALRIGLLLASATAFGETLVWWRFGEKGPGLNYGTTAIVNAANPGTCDGRCYCVSAQDWNGSLTGANAPRGCSSFPEGVKLYDPVSGWAFENAHGLNLNSTGSTSSSGSVKASDPSVFRRQTFTAEAFIRMSAEKAQSIAGNTSTASAPHPIFSVANGTTDEEWSLLFYKNTVASRLRIDSWSMRANGTQLNDGRWHHVAITADGSSGTSVTVKLYLDYNLFYETTRAGQFNYSSSADFNIGVNPFAGTRKYPGEVDEFRFSDVALTADKFLRFSAPADGLVTRSEPAVLYWDALDFASAPSTYWFCGGWMLARGRKYYSPKTSWTRKNYKFGGDEGLGAGAYVAECMQAVFWSRLGGEEVLDAGSFRTINKETVVQTDQQQGGYVILAPPSSATPLTAGDFTLEYCYKSNGGNKLGANATILMYPTDANSGEYKTPDPVMQHFFTASGTSYFKFKNLASGFAVESQHVLPYGLDSAWHRMAVVYDKEARRLKVHVDRKVVVDAENVVLPETSQGIVLGARGRMWNNNNAFDGWIDEVRITGRALSGDDLMQRVDVPPGMSILIR